MKIHLSQINSKIGAFESNYRAIMKAATQAAQAGSRLVIFPELSLCGYLHRDSVKEAQFVSQSERYLRMIAENAPPDVYLIVGAPHRANTSGGGNDTGNDTGNAAVPLHNACAVIGQGRIIHWQAKSALPTYDIFDEHRYYTPADSWDTFTIDGRVCGIAICEDVWQAERYSIEQLRATGLGRCKLPLQRLDLLIVCSASPYEQGKLRRRLAVMQKCCAAFDIDAVYVNAVGGQDGILFDGRSFAINRTGTLTHLLPMYQEHTQSIALADAHTQSIALESAPPHPTTRLYTEDPHAEIHASLTFGLKEYVHKNGFRTAVLGLSGGIDSALTATLAATALGGENVTALIMPSIYNSPTSMQDATTLADTLGIPHITLPITSIFAACTALLRPAIYNGYDIDITEQNLQARIRGMLVMAHANTTNSLPLATGNKSELAVGYCTQYGDMVGALAVIGDLYKTEVYQLATYLNRQREIIPRSIIDKPPSAELKPNQTDQHTLPPADQQVRSHRLYIEERASLPEIIATGIDEQSARAVIALHHKSEHKRTQAAPVIRVSKKAFGLGRRMLISRTPFELK